MYAKYFPLEMDDILSATVLDSASVTVFFLQPRKGKGPKLRTLTMQFALKEVALKWALHINERAWQGTYFFCVLIRVG
jgi:hypothetical protein